MRISVTLSKEAAEYFANTDLSTLIDNLLDVYDYTNLPAVSRPRYTYRNIEVTNEAFLSLYNSLGPHNKKVSLSRVIEFACDMDILATNPEFACKAPHQHISPSPTPAMQQVQQVQRHKRLQSLVYKAYRALMDASSLYDTPPEPLTEVLDVVRAYYNVVRGGDEL